ncbi:MAG: hypothetical protein PWQ93_857 [Clostridiales bacterium]|nr:hypothetical protein [Clostridiales bacterium]
MAIEKRSSDAMGFTPVQNNFIDNYIKDVDGDYVKVYLCMLRQYLISGNMPDISVIADLSGLSRDKVRQAQRYWCQVGFFTTPSRSSSVQSDISLDDRPSYTPSEINASIQSSNEIALLFKIAEEKLERLLSTNDIQVIYSLYDWLGLPVEVIIMLLEHCRCLGKRNIRYIEKVAVEWAQNGIDSIEKAEQHLRRFEKRNIEHKKVCEQLGIYGNPTKRQAEYMDKWLYEWNMPLDVVLLACDQTVNTREPSFAYIDAILERWRNEGVCTVDDAEKAIQRFIESKKAKTSGNKKPTQAQTKNSFHNFPQRDYDFKQLEHQIQENNLKRFKG